MKSRSFIIAGLAAALACAPVSPAAAHGHDHGGPLLWPFAAVAAVVAGTAILVTAPLRAVARESDYDAGPRYYAPQPQVYYAPPQQAYYAPPPGYYPAPQYYAPPQGYYYPARY